MHLQCARHVCVGRYTHTAGEGLASGTPGVRSAPAGARIRARFTQQNSTKRRVTPPLLIFCASKNDPPTRVRYCDFLTSWGLRSSQRPGVQAASASQQSGASNGTSSGCPLGQIIIQGEFQHPCGARQANDRAAMPVFVPCKNPDEAPFCYGAGAGSSLVGAVPVPSFDGMPLTIHQ